MAETRFLPDTQHRFHHEKISFWHVYLGLLLQLFLFIVFMVVAAIVSPIFFDIRNISNLFKQSVPLMIMALALVLPSRVNGIDLSAGAVFAASACVFASFASENMAVPGLIIALAIGLAVGAVNGMANMFIHIPSAVLTMTVSAAVTFVVSLMIGWGVKVFWGGRPIYVESKGLDVTTAAVGSLFIALILVMGLINFTRLGGEGQIQKRLVFTAYTAGGLLYSIAAVYLVMRNQMGSPILVELGSTLYLLFVAGAIYINRSARIRFMPMVCALMAALSWNLMPSVLSILDLDYSVQRLMLLIFTAAIIIPAFFVQRGCRSRI